MEGHLQTSMEVSVDNNITPHPKYISITLDRTFSNKQHIQNTKMKVATRNNLLKKLEILGGDQMQELSEQRHWLLYGGIHCSSMGPIVTFTPTGPRIEPGMSIDYWIPQAYQRRELVFYFWNCPSWRRNVCSRVEKNTQMREETHSLSGYIVVVVCLSVCSIGLLHKSDGVSVVAWAGQLKIY